jgi:hypothetical protein
MRSHVFPRLPSYLSLALPEVPTGARKRPGHTGPAFLSLSQDLQQGRYFSVCADPGCKGYEGTTARFRGPLKEGSLPP